MKTTIRRRTQIEIQTREITVIRTAGYKKRHYCQDCFADVLAFDPESLAGISQQTVEAVGRRVESGQLHFVAIGSGLICGNSLEIDNRK